MAKACRYGRGRVTVGLPAKVARLVHALAPSVTDLALGLVNRLLPKTPRRGATDSQAEPALPGKYFRTPLSSPPITTLGDRAARKFNENAA